MEHRSSAGVRQAASEGEDGVRRGRWLPWLALVSTLVLSFLWKSRCLDYSAWSAGDQYDLYCYSDLIALWFTRGISEGLVPYLQEVLEYPPLIGLQIWVSATVARWVGGGVGWFFTLNALVNAGAAGWILSLLRRQGLGPGRLLWWAAAPALALYAFHNWDLPALALLVWAISLHREGRDGMSGLALGLGASAKLVPLLALPLFVVARLREHRTGAALRVTLAATLTWGAVNVPVAVANVEGWSWFFRFSSQREITVATVWAALHRAGILEAQVETVNLVSGVSFLVGFALIVAVGVSRHLPRQIWLLTLPTLAWFLITNKVFSPQFDLWPIPLLVLSGSPGMLGGFLAADMFVFFSEFSFLEGRGAFWLASGAAIARIAVLGWIVVGTVRRVRVSPSTPGIQPHFGVGSFLRKRNPVPDGREVDQGGDRQGRHQADTPP